MIKAIIVEDEQDNRDILSHFVEKYCPTVSLCGMAAEVDEAYVLVKRESPNLIFLDIDLGSGNGFDLLDLLGEFEARVIFITAFNEFAIKAFKYSAIDYLLKPVQIDELTNAVRKVELALAKDSYESQLDILKEQIVNASDSTPKNIAIPMQNKVEIIDLDDIVFIEADGKYSHHLTPSRRITSSKNIGEYEKLLPKDRFVRIHNSYLLNLSYLESFDRFKLECTLNSGEKLPVSRRRKENLIQHLSH